MLEDNLNNELFEKELRIIRSSREYIAAGKYDLQDLAAKFSELIVKYQQLLKLTRKIFKISDRHSIELKRREAEIKNLLDNSSQGFLTFGSDLIINKEYSAECNNIFGKKIGGMSITEVLAEEDLPMRQHLGSTFQKIYSPACATDPWTLLQDLPTPIWIGDKIVEVQYKIVPSALDYQQEFLIMIICTDITARYQAEEQIKYLSFHDKLTSLYNRAYVDSVLPILKDPEYLPFSIIMGDMNGLKLTNDVFGHKDGDKLLVNMADVLTKCSRQGDIVARWGGDEFIILLPKTDAVSCLTLCSRIKDVCRNFKWDPIELSISLGSSTQESGQVDFSELFRAAENEMYAQKSLEIQSNKKRIIQSMEKILINKCSESQEHIERITEHSVNLYRHIAKGAKNEDIEMVGLLGKLHDVGKVALDEELFRKHELGPQDQEKMKSHSEIGYRMAKAIGESEIAPVILAVHERWDGQGYPRGLSGEEIPLLAQVIAIVHEYENLTNLHPNDLTAEEALLEITKEKEKAFNSFLVDKFAEIIKQDILTDLK